MLFIEGMIKTKISSKNVMRRSIFIMRLFPGKL
jgi:hypothetical protein